jgi:hypothetical protein
MSQQIALFRGLRGGEYDDLTPFRQAYFPSEYLPGLEALYRAEGHLAATGRLQSDAPCPYRAGKDLFFVPPPGRQLRLFDEGEPMPVALNCDCPQSHILLRAVGQRIPTCAKNRCPVRTMVLSDA